MERLVEPVEAMHRVIASRSFNRVGLVGRPIRSIHDTVAGAVYGSIRVGATVLGALIDRRSGDPAGSHDGTIVRFVNAVWGDDLGRHQDALGLDMVMLEPSQEPAEPTGHIVVLVHGLGQSESSWSIEDAPDLVDLLGADPELTPLLVRYNTGRSVESNGRDLAELLESTTASWPVVVERITVVGHSLGGLVARSACVAAGDAGFTWLDLVGDLITTGAPHTGAPTEKAAHVAAWGLSFARTTRPLATFVNRRSRGIKDLRFGALRDSDWDGDADALLRTTRTGHPLPAHITHHAIAATLTETVDGPTAWLVGDGMVRTRSATAPPGDAPANVMLTGSVGHFSMQRTEAVLDTIMACITPPKG